MAHKKSHSKKVAGKPKVVAKNPAKKPVKKPTPPKPQYEDVLKARNAMNAADEQVIVAGRALNRAKSDFADSTVRRESIEKAGAVLRDARAKASATKVEFKRIKKAAS